MKVSISYPPLESDKGVPLLSQNRQFQWFCEPTYIYPMVPAYAATLLNKAGYEVVWDDGIAEEKSYDKWLDDLIKEEPDLIAIETKTPVVKRHWRIIDDIKDNLPKAKVVLMGDHVTALPLESFMNSKVDFVITGGDYDFMLLNLVKWLEGKAELEPGIYYRDESGNVKSTGKFRLDHDLNSLPFIDRDLTKWWLYAYKNGNYKRTPGTYTMVGRDCWHRKNGGCTFCLTPDTKIFTVNGFIEIKEIVDNISKFDGAELTVLTHNSRFRRVNQVFKHWYEGKIIEIYPYYLGEPIKLTPYHRVYALRKERLRRCSKRGSWSYYCILGRVSKRLDCNNCERQYYKDYKPELIKAGELKEGDYLVIPIPRQTVDMETIDLRDILQDSEIILVNDKIKFKRSKYVVPVKIPVSKEFMRLVGYYLAEGHVTKSKDRPNTYYIGFTFSQKEEDLAEDVIKIFKNIFGIELRKTYNNKNKTIQLYVGCNIIAKLFKNLFGSNSYDKKLPSNFMFLPVEKQKELVISLFKGDAHLRKRNKKGGSEYIYETSSEILARQVFVILTRLNVIPSFSIKDTRKWKHKVPMYRISLSSIDILELFKEELPKANRRYKHGFILGNYIFIPIKKIERRSYEGYVYNLSVGEDHSYVANFVAVKNCAWTVLYPKYRVRKPELLVEEIGMLIEKYKVKEVFDDTGTFPVGNWLRRFCKLMIERGYNEEIYFSCNMRFGALEKEDYELMAEAGFRMLLFGLESASDETLRRINKGVTVDRIIEELKWASEAGLEPHITIMVGYPWETKEDAMRTVKLARWLFEKGYASTLQATIVVPYPGTKMFEECKRRGLLVTEDWDEYDMRRLVMKCPIDEEDVKELTQELYKSFFTPKYVIRRLLSIRSFEDVKFVWRGVKKVIGHIKDFAT